MEKWAFEAEGLPINVVTGLQYIGAYVGLQEDRGVWVQPQTEQWTTGIQALVKVSKRHPQTTHAGLGMLQQLE